MEKWIHEDVKRAYVGLLIGSDEAEPLGFSFRVKIGIKRFRIEQFKLFLLFFTFYFHFYRDYQALIKRLLGIIDWFNRRGSA